MEPLIWIVVVILVAGVLLWGLSQMPIDPQLYRFARVAIIVVVAILLIWTIYGLLVGGGMPALRR